MNIYEVANDIVIRSILSAPKEKVSPACEEMVVDLQSIEADVNGKESAAFMIHLPGESFIINVTRRS